MMAIKVGGPLREPNHKGLRTYCHFDFTAKSNMGKFKCINIPPAVSAWGNTISMTLAPFFRSSSQGVAPMLRQCFRHIYAFKQVALWVFAVA